MALLESMGQLPLPLQQGSTLYVWVDIKRQRCPLWGLRSLLPTFHLPYIPTAFCSYPASKILFMFSYVKNDICSLWVHIHRCILHRNTQELSLPPRDNHNCGCATHRQQLCGDPGKQPPKLSLFVCAQAQSGERHLDINGSPEVYCSSAICSFHSNLLWTPFHSIKTDISKNIINISHYTSSQVSEHSQHQGIFIFHLIFHNYTLYIN